MTTIGRQLFYHKIETMTGIQIEDLEKVERLMFLEDKTTQVSELLRKSCLPPAYDVMRRMLTQPGLALNKKTGTAKFKFDSSSAEREVIIHCRLSLRTHKQGWRILPVLRVQVACRLVNYTYHGGYCEFRQDIFVVGRRGCRIRKREGRFSLKRTRDTFFPTKSPRLLRGLALAGVNNGP